MATSVVPIPPRGGSDSECRMGPSLDPRSEFGDWEKGAGVVGMNYPLIQGYGGPETCHGGGVYRAKVNVGKDFFVDKKPHWCFII